MSHKVFGIALAIVICTSLPVSAQKLIATIPAGNSPWGMAVNPVTQKLYVFDACFGCQGNASVSVIDENTYATTTVPVGYPGDSYLTGAPIAVNKTTNKIYVVNTCGNDLYCGGNGTVTVIDGATLATTTVEVGFLPEAIAIDEVTNKIFVVNQCGYSYCSFQTLTIIDGSTLATTTVGTGWGYYYTPPAVAVNPITNKVFVVNACGTDNQNCSQGNVMMIDPVTLSNTFIPVGRWPGAIAVNTVTNKIYVGNGDQGGASTVTVIDGVTLSTSTVALQQPITQLAVDDQTNKIYLACGLANYNLNGQLAVIDGATLATSIYNLVIVPTGLAIDKTTNNIYISGKNYQYIYSYLTIFNGSNFSTLNLAVGVGASNVAVDETNNRIYTENDCVSPSNCETGTLSVIDGNPLPAWQFVPLTPCRVVDTRNPDGPLGGPPIQGGTSRNFPLPQGTCQIPSTATAYQLNVTVAPHASLAYLTIWPSGQPQPVVSTMNSEDGRVKANAAIVAAGTDEAVSVYASDTTDVILDISGYYVALPNPNALAFYPLTPCRVADTRNPNGPLGGPILQGGQQRDFPILQASQCGIPDTAEAYSLNFTVVPQDTLGYLTVWPAGELQPVVSTLNDGTGTIVANAAVIPAGTNGDIDAYVTDNTNLIIDIDGYFASPGPNGLSLYAPPPCRVLDSRMQFPGNFSGSSAINVVATGCGAPTLAQAFVLNATVLPTSPLGYLTLWPDSEQQPFVSTLNAVDGAITSNMAIVTNVDGSIDAFASSSTYLILDISAYFSP